MKLAIREERHGSRLESVGHDVRLALRVLVKRPGFFLLNVLILSIAIGANVAIFTVTNAALFKGFPLVDRNERILYLTTSRYCCVSYPDFEDWRAQSKSFQDMALVRGVQVSLSDTKGGERYSATELSAHSFQLLGSRPMLGRDFLSSDEAPGASRVAIISHDLWEGRYGNDPAIVGRTIKINGVQTTIIGVMPKGFSFPQRQDLWLPLVPTALAQTRENRDTWFVFGRLAGGFTIEAARTEMTLIGELLETEYPANKGFLPQVRTFHEFFVTANEPAIYGSLWSAVGFVMLIACANVANLLLAQAIRRSPEVRLRLALGAGRWRILRQFLIESLTLATVASVFGWWLARLALRAYELAPRSSSWRALDYTMDYRVLAYVITLTIISTLLFGLAPARRLSILDLDLALKTRQGQTDKRGRLAARLLVGGEMALAVVLLAGAGVMIRSFINIYSAHIGVKPDNVLTMSLWLLDAKYLNADAKNAYFDRLKTRLDALPGVASVSTTTSLPTSGSLKFPYELDYGFVEGVQQRRPTLSALVVSPGYFQVMGAALQGRDFTEADGISGLPVAIANERFASTHWPGENPLGKRLRLYDKDVPDAWLTVVGLASNIVQNDPTGQEFDPLLYLPYRQKRPRGGSTVSAGIITVIARTTVPPTTLVTPFRREAQALDFDLPIVGPTPLREILQRNSAFNGLVTFLLALFAAIALLLAVVGLYAVIAHSVSESRGEIGVRMAIGATKRDIFVLVLHQGLLPSVVGLIIGIPISFLVNRLLRSELVNVAATDPTTYLGLCLVLIASAMLGCWIPAHRAMHVDPADAVRQA